MKWKSSNPVPAIFLFFLIIGLQTGISAYYYYSTALWIVYFLSIILVFFAVKSNLYVKPIAKNQFLALIFILLLLLASWFIVPHFKRFGIYPFALLCFLYSGVLFYNKGARFNRLIFIFFFIICTFNIFPLLFFIAEESLLTRPLINTIFLTNPQESIEYLKGKFSLVHIIVMALFLSSSLYLLFLSEIKVTRVKANPRVKTDYYLLLTYTLSLSLMLFTGPVAAILSEYRLYRNDRELMQNIIKERKQGYSKSAFQIQNRAGQASKVMIIIGESLNRNFMGIYGQRKNTTPNLEKLLADTIGGRMYLFNDIISPEVSTIPSLRKVLTNINNENKLSFEKCVTIIDLLKRAGYKTFWISNQRSKGSDDTPNAVFAMTADYHFFTDSGLRINSSNAGTGESYDSVLLPVIKYRINQPDTSHKQAYFVHLMGSHYFYSDRYPKSFERFKPNKENDTNTYLNTVFFNDFVVGSIIRMARENDFDIVCYFSDHGEDMRYQHNQEKYRRGMSTIPFLVYLSANYEAQHPDLAAKLLKNKNTPGMTDNFFQDIQVICGFSSSIFNPSQSFLDKAYHLKKRRVINNKVAFD